jgi:hypoxanthine phosphoribosyltransferase
VLDNIQDVVISEEQLKAKVRELAAQISEDYKGKDLVLVGVLKGAVMFMVDLARALELPLEMDFMAVSSYGASTSSSGVVRIIKDLDASIEGRDILIVEDIVDTGLTLKYICDNLLTREPSSLRICALLNKHKERKADVKIDYVGFDLPDKFVVGYGLDYAENYRNLPFIGLLSPSAIHS